MAERPTYKKTFKFLSEAIASGVVFEKGNIAVYDTATDTFKTAVTATNTTQIPLGHFEKSGTGDGTTVIDNVIRLFDELVCYGFTNAGSNTVVAGDRFSTVYLDGAATVCNLSTNRSAAGTFIAFSRADEGFGATPICYVAMREAV